MSEERRRRVQLGRVVSTKADKSITVEVSRLVQHPMYRRTIRSSKKFMAHDEHNRCAVGDTVRIIESRPLSRRKRWRLLAIVAKAQ
ncbi:MAG: 30S ribosomal protein S17 [Candidatus Tectomicrobia bacterium]|nr:30S ribosomal protein S17 [Candidatus Tectomicrobia bacterium]